MTPLYDLSDTIAAIATPSGTSGIAVIKISGPSSLDILRRVFVSHTDPGTHPRHMILGTVRDVDTPIDKVLACYMKAPASYTGDDVVEIQCHGGQLLAEIILGLTISVGARLAEPGEFTRRAFLNGKIDLIQAESIMELISAHNRAYAEKAERLLAGDLSRDITAIRESLKSVTATCEATIEFEDSDGPGISPVETITNEITNIMNAIRPLIAAYDSTRKLNRGYTIALTGPVNSGKSTLFNTLLGYRRAIVHDHPGTTRDWITEHCTFPAADVILTDTAGIRMTSNSIEKAGIDAAHDIVQSADIILHLNESPDSESIGTTQTEQHHIYVATKADLRSDTSYPSPWIPVSCKTGSGIVKLKTLINDTLTQIIDTNPESPYIVTSRQHTLLNSAYDRSGHALEILSDATLELAAQDLHEALLDIHTLIGTNTQPDILDTVFSRFCIGK